MKIVYCVDQLYHTGGIEKMVVQKANWLSRRDDFEVFIIASSALQNPFFPLSSKVQFINLDIPYYSDIRLPRFFRLIWAFLLRDRHRKKLRITLNNISPDVVIVTDRASMLFVSIMSLSSRPLRVFEMHLSRDYYVKTYHSCTKKALARLGRVRENISFHGYDRIVVLSEEESQKYDTDNPKIRIIPNFVYDNLPKASSLDSKVVITGGRLVKEKGFSSMVSAFRRVSAVFPDWQLHIYGEGPEKETLFSLIAELGLEGKVCLKGLVNDFPSMMRGASVFCITSISEAFSLVTLEAISAGLPVVAFDIEGGLRDMVKDGINGFLVPYNNEFLLAEKLIFLLGDSECRLLMGQQSRRIAEQFTADKIMPQWIELFYERATDQCRSIDI